MENRTTGQRNVSLEEALEIIETYTAGLRKAEMALSDVQGEVLCADVLAAHDQPPFPRSPLDGYAFRGEDSMGASKEHPVILRVIDKFRAGEYRLTEVKAGECIRIMTGAPIPTGANAVIRQEDTDYGETQVKLFGEIAPWKNICFQGEDYKKGDLLLPAETRLDFMAVAILASNGMEKVTVYPKPKVIVLATGDELIRPGEPLATGKIYNSNLYMVKARLKEWGIENEAFHVGDCCEIVKQKIVDSLKDADAVITTGGVSVGETDILNAVLAQPEMEVLFDGVKMKPGSPAKYALCNGKPVLALSGNPFAAAVTLELFAKPMIDRLMNLERHGMARNQAVLENAFPKASKRRRLIRGAYKNGRVCIPEGHSSGQIFSMIGCNCLVDIPEGSGPLEAGSRVEIIKL